MAAPFEPVTPSVTVAVKRSPILLVLVQTLSSASRRSVVPAAMTPAAPSAVPGPFSTVLPLLVVGGVVAGGVGVVFGAGGFVFGRGVVVRGGVVAGVFSAGTSCSSGWTALSPDTRARSR